MRDKGLTAVSHHCNLSDFPVNLKTRIGISTHKDIGDLTTTKFYKVKPKD